MKMVNDRLKKFATPGPVEFCNRVAESRYWSETRNARGTLTTFGGYVIIRWSNPVSARGAYVCKVLFHAISLKESSFS